jgi:hypothetical protein
VGSGARAPRGPLTRRQSRQGKRAVAELQTPQYTSDCDVRCLRDQKNFSSGSALGIIVLLAIIFFTSAIKGAIDGDAGM